MSGKIGVCVKIRGSLEYIGEVQYTKGGREFIEGRFRKGMFM